MMDSDDFDHIERRVSEVCGDYLPQELRAVVLGNVRRELRAGRWDRRLARAAVLLVGLGVGVNAAAVFHADGARDSRIVKTRPAEGEPGLIATAIVVARATDEATARQYARWLAAMSGHNLSVDEAAAIDRAVRRSVARGPSENEG